MDIDKIADKVETLIEKVRNLKYNFNDESLEQDAQEAKESAVASLENWLEMVTQDCEISNGETQSEEESD